MNEKRILYHNKNQQFRIKINRNFSINKNSSKTLQKENSLFITNTKTEVKEEKILSFQLLKGNQISNTRKKALTGNFQTKLKNIAFSLKKCNLYNENNINYKHNLKLKTIFSSKKIKNNFEMAVTFQSSRIFIASSKKIQLNILKQQFEFICDNLKSTIRLLLDTRHVINTLTKNALETRKEMNILEKLFSYNKFLKKNNIIKNVFKFIYDCYSLISHSSTCFQNNEYKDIIIKYRKNNIKSFIKLICLLYKILELLKEFIKILLYFFKNQDILNLEELELQKEPILIELEKFKSYFQVFTKISEHILFCWMALEKFFELFDHNFLFVYEKFHRIKMFLDVKYFHLVIQNLRILSSNTNNILRNFESILDIK